MRIALTHDQLRSEVPGHSAPPRRGDLFVETGSAGMVVNEHTAMQIAAVYRCVSIIATGVASLPLITYERIVEAGRRRGKERAEDFYLFDLLHSQPNEYQTAFEFMEFMTAHLALRGNAYARIVVDGAGRITELVPVHPDWMRPDRTKSGKIFYWLRTPDGRESKVAAENILHLRGLSFDGLRGLSPLELARNNFTTSMATEQYASKFFTNAARPSGVLEHPGKLSEEASKRLKKSFDDVHAGSANAFKTMLLEEGMAWKSLSLSNEDSQFLENRRFQKEEIACIFGVPPHMLGDLQRATFSNIEHQNIEFYNQTLSFYTKRIEQRFRMQLLLPFERSRYFFEFLLASLMRGDLNSRYAAYSIGRNGGWLSTNEIRSFENMNPLPGDEGDQYLVPLNMIPASDVGKVTEPESEESDRSEVHLHIEEKPTPANTKRIRTWRDAEGQLQAEVTE